MKAEKVHTGQGATPCRVQGDYGPEIWTKLF